MSMFMLYAHAKCSCYNAIFLCSYDAVMFMPCRAERAVYLLLLVVVYVGLQVFMVCAVSHSSL